MPPGPELESEATVHTPLEELATYGQDLDGDGTDELVTVSQDGIAQRYDPEEGLAWSVSYREMASHLGLRAPLGNADFEGDYEGELRCTSDDAVAWIDVDEDGVLDLVASAYTPIDEDDRLGVRSIVTAISGSSGEVLFARLFDGRVTSIAELPSEGRASIVVGEEDGSLVEFIDQTPVQKGSGSTTHVHALDLATDSLLWSHDVGEDWGKLIGLETGEATTGPVVTALVTGGFGEEACGPGGNLDPGTRHLTVLEAASGQPRTTIAADGANELLTGDLDDDGNVEIATRDPSGGMEVFDHDLAKQWTFSPSGEVSILDVAQRGSDLVVGYVEHEPGAFNHLEDEVRLAILAGDDGSILADVFLSGGTIAEASDQPTIDDLRLAQPDLDGDGNTEIVVRTERNMTALTRQGTLLWQVDADLTEPHVLTSLREEDKETLFTKGVWETDDIPHWSARHADLGHDTEQGLYVLHPRDPETGERSGNFPLFSAVFGSARVDITGDGVPDRITGGMSKALFAFDGLTQEPLWTSYLDNFVLDVYLEDVDRDGREEAIVESLVEVFAVDLAAGDVLWSTQTPPLDFSGSYRAFELADITGDGVRDVVLGTVTGRDQAWSPHESARAIVLDGTTGSEVWSWTFTPEIKYVNDLEVADFDGDGIPDVAVVIAPPTGRYAGAAVLDGEMGVPLWRNTSVVEHGQETYNRESLELVDADGDGGEDLAIQIRGGSRSPEGVVALDGQTGLGIWKKSIRSEEARLSGTSSGLGLLGGEDEDPLLVAAAFDDAAYVQLLSPEGEQLLRTYLPGKPVWEFATGDVTGDAVEDLVLPVDGSIYVLDGERLRGGEAVVAAQFSDLPSSKVLLFDADGDDVLEIEHLRTPMSKPIYVGPNHLIDFGGPAKAVGTLNLSG